MCLDYYQVIVLDGNNEILVLIIYSYIFIICYLTGRNIFGIGPISFYLFWDHTLPVKFYEKGNADPFTNQI